MKIKRLLAAACVCLMLCGCGSQESTTGSGEAKGTASSSEAAAANDAGESKAEEKADVSLTEVFEEIKTAENVTLPEMVELNDRLIERYYGVTADMVSDFAGGVDSSGVGQDEIVLMKAADESQVDAIREKLEAKRQSSYEQQQNYNADEAEKLGKATVDVNGLYVTLIVSNDSDAIKAIVAKSIG